MIQNEKNNHPFISRQSLSKLVTNLHPQILPGAHHFDHFSTSFLFSREVSPRRGVVTFNWLEIIDRINKHWIAEMKARLLVHFLVDSCVLTHTQIRKTSTDAHIFVFFLFFAYFSLPDNPGSEKNVYVCVIHTVYTLFRGLV